MLRKAREDRRSCARPPISGRAALAALVTLGLLATGSQALAYKISIQATLSGGAEVPRNDSKAQGQMIGTLDTDTNTLEWSVTYKGIDTPVIGAHFHGPVSYIGSTSEENAPIQVGTPGNLASPFHGVAKIDETQASDLKGGRYYFNVHSKQFPAGEIRGPVGLR
ncbi:CHRD domain-containing protein [Roseiarcus fermentans]|uniref:CHRD domain-containing protein n=2 Tax=Roseiarcus fermentans TaxID=1473586 RepID=A0A366EIW4_9HYPH|nr:CHRD domain-containing protein [Roseiarcus fermentans]RBP02303.1 CHRD domain-containing protein [Roseiarcus fermentans]